MELLFDKFGSKNDTIVEAKNGLNFDTIFGLKTLSLCVFPIMRPLWWVHFFEAKNGFKKLPKMVPKNKRVGGAVSVQSLAAKGAAQPSSPPAPTAATG